MGDWRKAWYTYGQCDTTISPKEYNDRSSIEEVEDMVVNPFTGEAHYEITEVDGTLPEDLVGVLYRNGECRESWHPYEYCTIAPSS